MASLQDLPRSDASTPRLWLAVLSMHKRPNVRPQWSLPVASTLTVLLNASRQPPKSVQPRRFLSVEVNNGPWRGKFLWAVKLSSFAEGMCCGTTDNCIA